MTEMKIFIASALGSLRRLSSWGGRRGCASEFQRSGGVKVKKLDLLRHGL
jgi:hypothetical protein